MNSSRMDSTRRGEVAMDEESSEEGRKLCQHFHKTLQGGTEAYFSFYIGRTKEYVAPFNLPWLIEVEVIEKTTTIPPDWGRHVRKNAIESDERTRVLDAMAEQRCRIFTQVIRPLGDQFVKYANGTPTGANELDFASHSLFYSLCEADLTLFGERLKKLFHVFFYGRCRGVQEPS